MPVRPIYGLLLLLLVAMSWINPTIAVAQPESSVDFIEVSADAEFPETIIFRLEARTTVDVEDVDLYWRAKGSGALTLAEPEFSQAEITEATYEADMSVRYLPPGVDIEYFWRITGSNGNVHDSPVATLFYIDERFEWQSVDGGLLSVWWYAGSDDYATEILNTANRTLIRLDDEYGLQADQHIRIIVYGDDGDFASALPPNSAEWIGGVAYSSLNHIVAQIAPVTGADREVARMIPHEVSHVVVHQASRNPYNTPPPWIDEGLATYIQESDDGRLDPILNRAVREGRLIPLGALKSGFPLDPDQALLSYAESLSVVAYLVDTYGTEIVGELVSVYREEVSHDQAIETVLGITIDELDADWKASLGYEGDSPLATDSSEVDVRALTIVGSVVALSAGVAAAVVIAALWRTRAYREVEDDESVDSVIQDRQTDP